MSHSPEISEQLAQQLSSLRAAYAARLPEKLDEIDAAWSRYLEDRKSEDFQDGDEDKSESLTLVHRLTHSLAGSGATFGCPEVSRHARRAENVLKAILGGETQFDELKRMVIEAAFQDLRSASVIESSEDIAIETDVPPPSMVLFPVGTQSILVFSDNPAGAENWIQSVRAFGYQVEVTGNAEAFAEIYNHQLPGAIILDCEAEPFALIQRHPYLAELLRQVAREKTEKEGAPPLIWTCQSGAVEARLQAVRLGGDAFFPHPVDVDSLLVKLDDLISIQKPDPFRVMIVDDEPALARLLSLILKQAGIETWEVTDPLDVMGPLVDFQPDLILMDVYMPGCKGTELAAVIRQQEAYIGIPIVFLSVETNVSKQMEAMRQGGDDFLIKPVQPRHLVSAITTRVARARVLQNLMQRDSLTGLLNHTKTKEQLAVEVDRVKRMGHSISLAMIDIDFFKRVNDSFGHATGDRVLRSLSRLLAQRLRQTDVIGRYGGEEFAVILSGTTDEQAKSVLDKVRVSFEQMRHIAGNTDFTVTFSAGIASAPPSSDPSQLSERADKALYEAKAQGRNRICLAPAPMAQSDS